MIISNFTVNDSIRLQWEPENIYAKKYKYKNYKKI